AEGEKKAEGVAELGLAAVGIGGVWNWKHKDQEELIPELADLARRGGVWHIGFDYDPKPKTQRNNNLALKRLARALRKAGAQEAYSVKKPPGPEGTKCGDGDFLVAYRP